MNETTNPPATAVAVAITPDPDRQLQRTISVGQFAIALIMLCGAVGGGVYGGIASLRGELAELHQSDALTDMRLKNIEAKCDGYDKLVAQRNEQWQEVRSDIASIKTSVANLEESRRERRQ